MAEEILHLSLSQLSHMVSPFALAVLFLAIGVGSIVTFAADAANVKTTRVMVFCDDGQYSDRCGANVKPSTDSCSPLLGSDVRWCRSDDGVGYGVAVDGINPLFCKDAGCYGLNLDSCHYRPNQRPIAEMPGIAVEVGPWTVTLWDGTDVVDPLPCPPPPFGARMQFHPAG